MKFNYISLIVGDPRGILDEHLKPRPIISLNMIILLNDHVELYIIK